VTIVSTTGWLQKVSDSVKMWWFNNHFIRK